MDLFSHQCWDNLKKQYIKEHGNFISDVQADIKSGYIPTLLSESFLHELKNIFNSKSLDIWTTQTFHWDHLLERLIILEQIHDDLENANFSKNENYSEELFNFWNESEYAHALKDLLEKNHSLEEASLKLAPLLENQIISYFYLNIFNNHKTFNEPILYTSIPEQGDGEKKIFLKGGAYYIETEIISDIFPSWALLDINWIDKEISFEIHSDHYTFPILENNYKTQNGILVNFHTSNVGNEITKINKAIGRLQKYTPHLEQLLTYFTYAIIPIDESGIVSFSLQAFPGFSSINIFERDDIDLMDDLIHENGHHYLNAILNAYVLFYEDDDNIFYSPWRRSPRPIRGIYHAYFTFIWAQKLFTNLSLKLINHQISEHDFSAEEVQKIYLRSLEENLMLEFCEPQLERAYELKKISDEGYEFFQEFKKLRIDLGQHFDTIKSHLMDSNGQKELHTMQECLALEKNNLNF